MNVDQPDQQDHQDLPAHRVQEVQQVQVDHQVARETWDLRAGLDQAVQEDQLESLVLVVLLAHLVLLVLLGQRASVATEAFPEGWEPQEVQEDQDQLVHKDQRVSQGKMDGQGTEANQDQLAFPDPEDLQAVLDHLV